MKISIPPQASEKTAASTGACSLDYFAKTMDHDLCALKDKMISDHIISALGAPLKEHADRGYFLATGTPEILTGKGQIWLARKYPVGADLSIKSGVAS